MTSSPSSDQPMRELASFPLLKALFGRRARRFALGMELPGGPLAFKSRHGPAPLSELEQAVLVAAATGVSGWNYGIPYSPSTEGRYSSYTLRFTGRTFPTGAGIGTPELFYTDDDGVYLVRTRDLPPTQVQELEKMDDIERVLAACRQCVTKIGGQRLQVPREVPHTVAHNLWNANFPGSTLFLPVADVSEYFLGLLAIQVQGRGVVYDDRNDRVAGNLEPYIKSGLLDDGKRVPLSQMEQNALTHIAASLAMMGHNIVLMLQAMGLGGWMYTGLNTYSVLGAFAEQGVPGLGFRFQRDERWPVPNPVGLDGYYESLCPPYYSDMHAAVGQIAEWKFGKSGAYDPESAGPFQHTGEVKGSVQPYSDEMISCMGEIAQYIYDTYGKFPGSVPTIFMQVMVQAQHIDTEFYDTHFREGAYLDTHAQHMGLWHDIP